jgi:pSer/pThr/pTyr-binding forkhead associated (FHA) protein
MKVKLIIVSPEVHPNEYDVALPSKIGRGHEARLKLVHPLVSRLHCELFADGEQVKIRDLDSLNGTFVDQQRIDEDTAIPSGATVIIGTVMFRVAYGKDAERLPPPASSKLERTAAAVGTIRSDAPRETRHAELDAADESPAPSGRDPEEELSMAPLDETTGNAPNGKGSGKTPNSIAPSDKASTGAAPGDDDGLDDFLESIM